jgi:hypothetical protein
MQQAVQRRLPVAAAAAAAAGESSAAAAHAQAAAAAAGRDGRRETAILGGEDFILSQRSGVEEALFKGKGLGVEADIAGVGLGRQTLLRRCVPGCVCACGGCLGEVEGGGIRVPSAFCV